MHASELLHQVRYFLYREVKAPLIDPYKPPAYRRVRGKMSGETLKSLLEPFKRNQDKALFEKHVRPTDIFLIGHPKSGNTWMAYMLAKVLQKQNMGNVTMASVGHFIPVIHGEDSSIRKFEHLQNPRIFRNEYPVHPELYPKTIYLLRDPRAALVSYYHMYCVVCPDAPMSLRSFVQEYLQDGHIKNFEALVRWDRQVLEWYARAQYNDRILLVKYEDMVKDRAGVLRAVLKFCGISCTESELVPVVEQSSFESMKRSEELHGAESYLGVKEKRGNFVRRGKIDGWKEEMEGDLSTQIREAFAPAMKAVGYL